MDVQGTGRISRSEREGAVGRRGCGESAGMQTADHGETGAGGSGWERRGNGVPGPQEDERFERRGGKENQDEPRELPGRKDARSRLVPGAGTANRPRHSSAKRQGTVTGAARWPHRQGPGQAGGTFRGPRVRVQPEFTAV